MSKKLRGRRLKLPREIGVDVLQESSGNTLFLWVWSGEPINAHGEVSVKAVACRHEQGKAHLGTETTTRGSSFILGNIKPATRATIDGMEHWLKPYDKIAKKQRRMNLSHLIGKIPGRNG